LLYILYLQFKKKRIIKLLLLSTFLFQAMIWFAKSEQIVFIDFDINEIDYINDICNFLNEVIICICYYLKKNTLIFKIL